MRVTRGFVSLRLGKPDEAAHQFREAIDSPITTSRSIDALFEPNLTADIRAYQVLAELAAVKDKPELGRVVFSF
jgi:hypothetical protein